jgi:hypothetical protein
MPSPVPLLENGIDDRSLNFDASLWRLRSNAPRYLCACPTQGRAALFVDGSFVLLEYLLLRRDVRTLYYTTNNATACIQSK